MESKKILIGIPGVKELVNLYNLPKKAINEVSIINTLASINRFCGRGSANISVLHHSIFVASILKNWGCSPNIVLGGFCHDFAEAFIGDIIKPIKDSIPGIKDLESSITNQISEVIDIGLVNNGDVKDADRLALCFEAIYCGFIINDWGIYDPQRIKADKKLWELLNESLEYSPAGALCAYSTLTHEVNSDKLTH